MEPTQAPFMNLIPTITQDEIVQYVEARAKNRHCPVCQQGNWMFMGQPGRTVALVGLSETGTFDFPAPTVPVVALACDHCANIRFHSLGMIAKWKSDGKP